MSEGKTLHWVTALILALACAAADFETSAGARTNELLGWQVSCADSASSSCFAIFQSEGAQFVIVRGLEGEEERVLMVHLPPSAREGDPVAIRTESGSTFQTRVRSCSRKLCEARIAGEANDPMITRRVADSRVFMAFRLGENMDVLPFSPVDFRMALQAMTP